MRIDMTGLEDARLLELEPRCDHRGYFARTFCEREFASFGLHSSFPQHCVCYTAAKGTLRGMHFQRTPAGEVKVVNCIRGAIYDVILDLRKGSPTHGRWQAFELTAENRRQLYIPIGFAHGYQTLTDDAEVAYLISEFYTPEAAGGVRYNDPAFAINWPLPIASISEKDKSWPDYDGRGI